MDSIDESKSVEELRQLLLEETRQRQLADQRAEEEKRHRQQADQRAQQEKRQRLETEQKQKKTTLLEYIEACHTLLFKNLVVQSDKRLTSKGALTKPDDKWCPARLLAWADFLESQ